MIEQNFSVLTIFLKAISGLFALLAALFTFLSVLRNEEQNDTKRWFSQKWQKISQSKWLEMPEKMIHPIVGAEKKLSNWIKNAYNREGKSILFITTVLFLQGWWIILGYKGLLFAFLVSLIITTQYLKKLFKNTLLINGLSYINRRIKSLPSTVRAIAGIIFVFFGPIIWIILALKSQLFLSIIYMILIIPYFFIFFSISSSVYNIVFHDHDEFSDTSFLLSASVGLSFSVTFFSFLLGSQISAESYIPQTLQMLLSNVFFDGLTLFTTIVLLRWSLKKRPKLRIPTAITLDLITAAIFACLSVFIGLLFTKHQLSIRESLCILVGRSPSGNRIELGPLFWCMHTTFIPTIIYIALIAMGYIGKLILSPVKWFFGKGQEHKNPLALTAALFTLLATIFAIGGVLVDGINEHIISVSH